MEQEKTKYEDLKSAGIIHRDTKLSQEEIEFVNKNLTQQEVDALKSIKAKVKGFAATKDWDVSEGFGF